MALSDYERRMLEQLETQLAGEDPEFVEALASEEPAAMQWAFSPKHLVIGLIIAMLGLGIVLAGVIMEIVPVGVLGVAIVFAGFWYLSEGTSQVPRATPVGGPQKSSRQTFMEKQAEEWLRRRDNNN